jgi:hypothetical protein
MFEGKQKPIGFCGKAFHEYTAQGLTLKFQSTDLPTMILILSTDSVLSESLNVFSHQ